MPARGTGRRLGLGDLMVLVGAAAAGMAVFQAVCVAILGAVYNFQELLTVPDRGWSAGLLVVRVVQWLGPTIPFGAAWTGVVPLLRLRQPRPSLRRVARQPGVVACLAALLGLGWATLGVGEAIAAIRITATPATGSLAFLYLVEGIFPDMGLAVAASWFGLWLAGRWRAVPDWPDRFGRLLGCYWIGLGLLWYGRRYLEALWQ